MRNERELRKISTRKYLFAMICLFLVATSLIYIQKEIIHSQEKYAHIINLSGRQRMLSQQMPLLLLERHITSNPQDKSRLLNEFNKDKKEFLLANQILDLNQSDLTSIINSYFQLADDALTQEEHLLSLSNFARNKLLPKLNQVVFKYEQESNRLIEIQQRFLIFVLFVLVVLILAGTKFIFTPVQNLYHQTFMQFKKTLEELELEKLKALHASKMATLGEMAGGIVHEINNPLTLIQGFTKLLKRQSREDQIDQKSLENSLDKIESMTIRISKIIKGLSAFSRATEAEAMSEVSLEKIVFETIELCNDRFRRHDISLEVEVNTPAKILCREVQISQVLLNLLNNSHDAIEHNETKWIKIAFTEKDYHYEISVTDSGKGISKELSDKIMQPFYTTKEKGKGTGLGLSISKSIIKDHCGQLELNVESQNTQFIIKLPKIEYYCLYNAPSES